MADKRQPMKPQLGNEIREPCYLRAEGVIAVAGNRASAVPQVVWSDEVAVQQVKPIKGFPETKASLKQRLDSPNPCTNRIVRRLGWISERGRKNHSPSRCM